jgi:hypothetical protein
MAMPLTNVASATTFSPNERRPCVSQSSIIAAFSASPTSFASFSTLALTMRSDRRIAPGFAAITMFGPRGSSSSIPRRGEASTSPTVSTG